MLTLLCYCLLIPTLFSSLSLCSASFSFILTTHIIHVHTAQKEKTSFFFFISVSQFSIELIIGSWGLWNTWVSLNLTGFFSFLYRYFDGSSFCNGELLSRYPRSGSLKVLWRICVPHGLLWKYEIPHEQPEGFSATHRSCQGKARFFNVLGGAMWGWLEMLWVGLIYSCRSITITSMATLISALK